MQVIGNTVLRASLLDRFVPPLTKRSNGHSLFHNFTWLSRSCLNLLGWIPDSSQAKRWLSLVDLRGLRLRLDDSQHYDTLEMIPLKQENCCVVAKWVCRGPPREAVCVFPILRFIYSRPCFSWKTHPSLLQLSCPTHRFKQKRENVSEANESSGNPGVRTGWMGQEVMFSPSTIRFEGGGWSWKLRQQKVPSPAYEPCRSCLEVSGCGSASPSVCVKGTGKLSQEDGSEQTCSGVGVRRSAIRAAPRRGFLTYQDTPFFILCPHHPVCFVSFLTSSISRRARELPYCPLSEALK